MKKCWILWSMIALLSCFLLPSIGFAQNCTDLSTDDTWTTKLQEMSASVATKQWDAALGTGRELYAICSDSPILNYYIGISLQAKGERVKSMQYLIAASENTMKFATPAETSRKIFFALYEAEHPDRTEEAITDLKERIASLENASQTNADETRKQEELVMTQSELHASDLKKAMWAGAGIGLAGVLFTAVGGTLAFMDSSHIEGHHFYMTDKGDAAVKENVKPLYSFGLGMLGAGLAMTVAGAVVTGIFGYKYTHFEDHSLSFAVTPEQISFGMTF